MPDITANDHQNEIILYQPDSALKLEVRLEHETVWLSQPQMAELFGRDRTVIGRHIRTIFSEGELEGKVVCANFAHTTQHGAMKEYNAVNGALKAHNVSNRRWSVSGTGGGAVLLNTPEEL